jgi:hypothetical protein
LRPPRTAEERGLKRLALRRITSGFRSAGRATFSIVNPGDFPGENAISVSRQAGRQLIFTGWKVQEGKPVKITASPRGVKRNGGSTLRLPIRHCEAGGECGGYGRQTQRQRRLSRRLPAAHTPRTMSARSFLPCARRAQYDSSFPCSLKKTTAGTTRGTTHTSTPLGATRRLFAPTYLVFSFASGSVSHCCM